MGRLGERDYFRPRILELKRMCTGSGVCIRLFVDDSLMGRVG